MSCRTTTSLAKRTGRLKIAVGTSVMGRGLPIGGNNFATVGFKGAGSGICARLASRRPVSLYHCRMTGKCVKHMKLVGSKNRSRNDSSLGSTMVATVIGGHTKNVNLVDKHGTFRGPVGSKVRLLGAVRSICLSSDVAVTWLSLCIQTKGGAAAFPYSQLFCALQPPFLDDGLRMLEWCSCLYGPVRVVVLCGM